MGLRRRSAAIVLVLHRASPHHCRGVTLYACYYYTRRRVLYLCMNLCFISKWKRWATRPAKRLVGISFHVLDIQHLCIFRRAFSESGSHHIAIGKQRGKLNQKFDHYCHWKSLKSIWYIGLFQRHNHTEAQSNYAQEYLRNIPKPYSDMICMHDLLYNCVFCICFSFFVFSHYFNLHITCPIGVRSPRQKCVQICLFTCFYRVMECIAATATESCPVADKPNTIM